MVVSRPGTVPSVGMHFLQLIRGSRSALCRRLCWLSFRMTLWRKTSWFVFTSDWRTHADTTPELTPDPASQVVLERNYLVAGVVGQAPIIKVRA